MLDLEYSKLDDRVYVYKNLISDPYKLVEILKKTEQNPEESFFFNGWDQWSVFGTYVTPTKGYVEQQDSEDFLLEQTYRDMVEEAFQKSTTHFLNSHGLKVEDSWITMGPSYCKYDYHTADETFNIKDDPQIGKLSMLYHTDYQWAEYDQPGNKFALTCTIYLNDDYEGGDVVFRIKDKVIPYKPVAGDVVIFPSGHPKLLSEDGVYFHAVRLVQKTEKYFIRYFYMIPDNGKKAWRENRDKYGEEVWNEMYKKIVQDRLDNGIEKNHTIFEDDNE